MFHEFENFLSDNFSTNRFALLTVLDINIATVIGPTPPGTGVMYETTFKASSKFTSPTKRLPLAWLESVDQNSILKLALCNRKLINSLEK